MINSNGSLEISNSQVMPAKFIERFLLPNAREQIQLVLQYKDVLLPEVYYAILMFEQRLEKNLLLQAISQGVGKTLEIASYQQADVAMLLTDLVSIVLDLEHYYREDL